MEVFAQEPSFSWVCSLIQRRRRLGSAKLRVVMSRCHRLAHGFVIALNNDDLQEVAGRGPTAGLVAPPRNLLQI